MSFSLRQALTNAYTLTQVLAHALIDLGARMFIDILNGFSQISSDLFPLGHAAFLIFLKYISEEKFLQSSVYIS